jgi:hypothetical protein
VRWNGNGGSSKERAEGQSLEGTLLPGCKFTVSIDVMDQFGWQIATDSSTQVSERDKVWVRESERARERERE